MLPPDFIAQLRAIYPKRQGGQVWPAVARLIPCYVQPDEWDTVVQGTKNYAAYCLRKGQIGTDFVMMARTFYGRDRHWEEYADMDMRSPAEIALDKQWAGLEARARALGFNEVDRSRGLATAEYAIKQEEDKRRLRVVRNG